MRLLFRVFCLTGLLIVSWSTASASFCTGWNPANGACIGGTGTSSGGVPTAAAAVFQSDGAGNLDITLINDAGSSTTQLGGAEILTALLFNLTGAGALTNVGSDASLTAPAVTGLGTAVLTSASTDSVSQNWGLGNGVNAYFSNQYSLSSTGLNSGIAGSKANLGGCTSNNTSTDCRVLDGPPWGLIPQTNAGGHAPGIDPVVNYFAFFSLAGLTSGLTNSQLALDLSNVVFQYGTNGGSGGDSTCIGCGQGNPVPEPSQIVFMLLTTVLIGFVAWKRRRVVA